jgi:hypothetical protein
VSAFAAASAYRAKGWSGTLPLPPGQKAHPPAGFTGYDGQWPTDAQVSAWMAADHNLALRLPPVVIGLDVDAYAEKPGGRTLETLTAGWGPLPPTWTTTSRDDGASGIRLYRVPTGIEDWPTEAGPGIELIRFAHRYAVVPPSVHPEGRQYRWLRPDGSTANGELPGLGDLPELPPGWLAGLTGHGADGEHVKPGSRAEWREKSKQAVPWLAALPRGEPCKYVARLAASLEAAARREDGDAYDHTRDAVMALLGAGEIGHPGVLAVLDRGRATYVRTVAAERGGPKVAEAEYDRFTAGGVVRILDHPSERAGQGCDCEPATLTINGHPATLTINGHLIGSTPAINSTGNPTTDELLKLFVNVVAYVANVPDDVPWVAKPLAYFGGVSLWAGIWKGGKSTLAAQMQRARETGEAFLGWPVPTGPTVLVTEEGGVPVKHKVGNLLQLDILDRRSAVMAGLDFDGVCAALRAYCEAQSMRVAIFIDTFAVWGDLEDENDAPEVTAAISKLTMLAQETSAAIVLVHHNRKDGGAHGRGIRGSGAIPATVDIFATLDRLDDKTTSTDRILRIEGRVIEPTVLHLLFDLETKTYTLQDDGEALRDELETWLVKVPADGDGLAYTELTDTWGISRGGTYARVEMLLKLGRMRQARGKRGNATAQLHWSIPSVWVDFADRRNRGDDDDD